MVQLQGMNEPDFLKVAKQAALEAGKIISSYAGKVHDKNIKSGDASNFATEADLKAEEIIISRLSKHFPDHNIISEEKGKTDKGSEYTWVVDPLDGSFAFNIGLPYFAVSIGLLKKGEAYLGVVYNIPFGDLYEAVKGKGAFLNGKPIKVSTQKILMESAFAMDFGHNGKRTAKLDLYVKPLFSKVGYIFSTGSTATILSLVGKGIYDGFVVQAWIWDFVAGTVIVREAGGKVTDFAGNEPDWSQERLNIVASNGVLHEQILEALK